MNKIKMVLAQKGIKQKWLAEQLGKSFNMVNSYVQNRTQPSIETLYKIASILEVEVDELLYSKEDIKRMNNVNLQ
ncbi:helix-turn-helix transcriptional regulator [Bacteroides caecigallinarum]|uniref:helix-turn-helix transcriptional regulator n=1 Tax=Bacteroidales TaxID=171549 RepID=UPI001F3B7852|nr:helix-turn-helix transcriptional regulator [Bacteroides caecigallinarum]MCF2592366.1 helix-turn-helix transcriptional regulator [Bacteroides caecigallinarum]